MMAVGCHTRETDRKVRSVTNKEVTVKTVTYERLKIILELMKNCKTLIVSADSFELFPAKVNAYAKRVVST
jgi:hypothetical protein